jgi:hypothetical protein
VLYLLASLVAQCGLGEAPLYIKSRLGDLFEGRVSMTLSSMRRVAAPASMTIVTSFSLPADPFAKFRLAVPASNRRFRRRRHTCSPGRSRPSCSCRGNGQWDWGWPVRARVGRSVRAALGPSPQRKGDVRPAEGDHRRDSETAGPKGSTRARQWKR